MPETVTRRQAETLRAMLDDALEHRLGEDVNLDDDPATLDEDSASDHEIATGYVRLVDSFTIEGD